MKIIIFVSLAFLMSTNSFSEWEMSGSFGMENQYFTDVNENNVSFAAEPTAHWSNEDENAQFIVSLYARHDNQDSERGKADIREFLWVGSRANWEFSAGIGKVFWGVTESNHLVDIVNQTDLAESADGEAKLGQPMLKVSTSQAWGIVDIYVLPYFRERRFPADESPLSSTIAIDLDNVVYESSAKEQHVDVALAYSQYIGNWDIGLSYFRGTNREPLLEFHDVGSLLPFYEQISQWGLTVQATIDAWLIKLESIQRKSDRLDFFASSAGLEYTFFGIADSAVDVGLLLEYSYDERDNSTQALLQNDLFFGARITPNDVQNTELLFGVIQDRDETDSQLAFVEASRRLNDYYKLTIDARFFSSVTPENPVYQFRSADYASITLEYFY